MSHIRFVFLLTAILTVNMLYASSPYIKDSENAILEIIYQRKAVLDTTNRAHDFVIDDVMLRVGSNLSLFCGVKRLWSDSLSITDWQSYSDILKATLEKDNQNGFFSLRGRYTPYIYKDQSKNLITECDFFNMTYWKYAEPLTTPEWVVTDSIKSCLGFDCIKATANFKGREWTVWFNPDIPIPEGPWKLYGLPGLIMEAYDKNHDYEFIPLSIKVSDIAEVGYMWYTPEKNHKEVSRDSFFKEWRKSKTEDTVSKIKSSAGIKSSTIPQKNKLAYDKEETDYEH